MRRVMLGAGLGLGAGLRAQPPAPAPLIEPALFRTSVPTELPATTIVTRVGAELALEHGFPEQAVQDYRALLALPGADRAELTRGLTTALLELGRSMEAQQALLALPEPRDSAWHLRAGLAAAQLRKIDAAREELGLIREAELTAMDRPWWLFLQATVADLGTPRGGDVSRPNALYIQAEEAANNISLIGRTRIQLAGERFRLRSFDPPPQQTLVDLRNRYNAQQGDPAYNAALDLAVGLDLAGRGREAVDFLNQEAIRRLPPQELYWQDRFRLVVGLIGDRRNNGAGRIALSQLLANGTVPEKQREALQLLAQSSTTEPERSAFRTELDRLIASTPRHSLLDDLYFYRAQIGLAEGRWREAEDNARKLLDVPRSPLKVQAFGVLVTAAWEQSRPREAANYASQMRDTIGVAAPGTPMARLHAELGVLQAEAFYQAGDYTNAGLAYAAAMREPPPRIKAGDLIFMRVLAEIKSGSGAAAKVIDEMAALPDFDLESRWQAEWSLARTLKALGGERTKEALDRVTRLLEQPDAGMVAPELRARMRWLQASLSLMTDQPERAIEQVNALLAAPQGVDEALWKAIASSALRQRAEAEFALGREAAALATLRQVRTDYDRSEAAAQSYLTEASYYASKDQLDLAQKALTDLTNRQEFRGSEFYSYAQYQFALYADSLGQPRELEEANRRIEDLMKNPPHGDRGAELIFLARLKQGEILRKLNEFSSAQRVYESLLTEQAATASTENLNIARLELAKCHNAQASDPKHAGAAKDLFANLTFRVDASPDVHAEAGFMWGNMLRNEGQIEEAANVWWNDVVAPFLREETRAFERDATRPYWIARTLLDYGDLRAKQNNFDEARRAYSLILERNLSNPAEGLARESLAKLGGTATK